MGEYFDKAREAAKDAAKHFEDEIVEEIIDSEGKTRKVYIGDYSDSYAHENLSDSYYNLHEAADVLDDLSKYEADDEGLWEGMKPRDAISVMAAETFRNAAESFFSQILEKVNDEIEAAEGDGLIWDFDDYLKAAEGEKDKGVLEWRPDEVGFEELDPDVQEEIQEEFEKKRNAQVKKIVEEAIESWQQ